MHKHQYTGGAVRGMKTYRYCLCGRTLFFYGNNKKPEIQKNDDYEYYLKLLGSSYNL